MLQSIGLQRTGHDLVTKQQQNVPAYYTRETARQMKGPTLFVSSTQVLTTPQDSSKVLLLLKASWSSGGRVKTNKSKYQSLEQRKVNFRASKDTNGLSLKASSSLKGFSKALLKARWKKEKVSCHKLLGPGILCSCSCPYRSGQCFCKSPNKQMLFSILHI